MERAACHHSGAYNFEMAPKLSQNMCTHNLKNFTARLMFIFWSAREVMFSQWYAVSKIATPKRLWKFCQRCSTVKLIVTAYVQLCSLAEISSNPHWTSDCTYCKVLRSVNTTYKATKLYNYVPACTLPAFEGVQAPQVSRRSKRGQSVLIFYPPLTTAIERKFRRREINRVDPLICCFNQTATLQF